MAQKMSRRQIVAAGGASAVFTSGVAGAQAPRQAASPGRAPFWGPGPDKNLARDLKPGPTPIRLAGSLNVGRPSAAGGGGQSIGSAVKALRDQGLTAAVTRLEAWQGASEAAISELRAALKEHDVEIFEVGGYRNILHTDESARQENLKYLARCLEIADRIGCRMVGTITGSRNPEGNMWADNYAVHPDNWTLETWKLTVSGIRQILKDTAGSKAVLGMEAQVTTNLDGPVAHRNLAQDVGDPRCKVNLDPTNMVHLHNHFHTTELINQCFDLLGEDIYGCHAKDSYVAPHTQTVFVQEVCPGRGNLDYETYLVRMSRLKWARALLPEHFPAEQNPEAYAYIRKTAAKVGVRVYGDK
ncbi:MAG: sugar phosphate isomerase/epimerase [Bryobacterales bacterium]|nr:sugar phosphate isomerase/epimerase [Bryobacterales bacterium]